MHKSAFNLFRINRCLKKDFHIDPKNFSLKLDGYILLQICLKFFFEKTSIRIETYLTFSEICS